MKLNFSEEEYELLARENILFDTEKEYDDDCALDLLDKIREAEVSYSQYDDEMLSKLYLDFHALGDKLYALIPS